MLGKRKDPKASRARPVQGVQLLLCARPKDAAPTSPGPGQHSSSGTQTLGLPCYRPPEPRRHRHLREPKVSLSASGEGAEGQPERPSPGHRKASISPSPFSGLGETLIAQIARGNSLFVSTSSQGPQSPHERRADNHVVSQYAHPIYRRPIRRRRQQARPGNEGGSSAPEAAPYKVSVKVTESPSAAARCVVARGA